ncbi:hypothetical protein [Saccharopolyspora pogona]|uniref:hypothetical protein n=1 Tax=Saccharopolyspora pogona TaxID=333966 RepID=UPI001689C489|nr:hypothetical protein [Saccharopolyspora pogona]
MSRDEFIGGLRRGRMAGDHFTLVTNALARDPRLSLKAKGLFLNLASHKEGFDITVDLIERQNKDGKTAIDGAIKELQKFGYVYRGERIRYPAGTVDKNGKNIGGLYGPYTWWVTDDPDEVAQILKQVAKERGDDAA